jgi:hypothetical protein
VFSKNRAAQLDLLLRSLEKRATDLFDEITVLYRSTNHDYLQGYARCFRDHPTVRLHYEHSFQSQLGDILDKSEHKYVSFLCDDDVVSRNLVEPVKPWEPLEALPEVLCFSLRLGLNTTECYPLRRSQRVPSFQNKAVASLFWSWPAADGDWGYPGSVDGHVFRRYQVIEMLSGVDYTGPNRFEEALTNRCFGRDDRQALMCCYRRSLITGVPVNRVQDKFPNRNGEKHPVSTLELNTAYMEGKKLKLPKCEGINAAHVELPLVMA